MISILSDPAHVVQVSPAIISRWLATESPNNFRLQRKDILITGSATSAGSPPTMQFTLATPFDGAEGDSISVYNSFNGAMATGTVTDIASPATTITTDIPYASTFAGAYLNNNTFYGGYYFEGQLTVNGVVQTLTVIASPNSFGAADLDVSGVLRIMTSLGKTGDGSAIVMAETNKSGSFTFAYRGAWYGSSEAYTAEGNTWYYAECVRSVEQGSNLYEYVYTALADAPFLNSFVQPVFFAGLPFDLSFIVPDLPATSPAAVLQITLKRYNANATLLNTTVENIAVDALQGYLCSLNIDPASIEDSADYMTAEIALA